jgi:molecular chaperone GrpE
MSDNGTKNELEEIFERSPNDEVAKEAEQHADEPAKVADKEAYDIGAEVSEAEVSEARAEVETLQKHIEELKRENEELRDKWLRAVAEYQNLRRRVMSERAFAFREGKRQTLVELLSVLDDLERSIEAMREGEALNLDAIREGIELVHRQFVSALQKLGVKAIPSLNERFDPNLHEAVERVETEGVEDGTIIEEVQRGYVMDDIVLRPARVKVAVSPIRVEHGADEQRHEGENENFEGAVE